MITMAYLAIGVIVALVLERYARLDQPEAHASLARSFWLITTIRVSLIVLWPTALLGICCWRPKRDA